MKAYRYERRGLLAIDPKALMEVFFVGDRTPENTEQGEHVIVDIRGPLEQHAHPWCDSYESICARVEAACATSARAVILRFDSPGGDAGGCFEAADAIREACDRANKELHAFVEGDCCSAAYALACRADSITMSETSIVGSIGVMSCREDVSAMNAARGLRVALITSGARKGDGHPDQPITEAELAQTQSTVDALAALFFAKVSTARGLSTEAVAQLEARTLPGPAALAAGLVDEVGPLASVIARIGGVATGDKTKMATAYEKARKALQEAAEGDDANAKAAQRALAAMEPADGEDKDEPEPADGDAQDPAEDKPKDAPSDADAAASGGDDDDNTDAAATSASASVRAAMRAALKAEQRAAAVEAKLRARDEADERAALIASRPGLSAEMVTLLKRAPMELVRETIKDIPPSTGADVTLRPPTQGSDAHGSAARLPLDAKAQLDARMGLAELQTTAINTEYKLALGVRQAKR